MEFEIGVLEQAITFRKELNLLQRDCFGSKKAPRVRGLERVAMIICQ